MEQSIKPVLSDIGGVALTVGEGFAAWIGILARLSSALSEAYQWVKRISDLLPSPQDIQNYVNEKAAQFSPDIGDKFARNTLQGAYRANQLWGQKFGVNLSPAQQSEMDSLDPRNVKEWMQDRTLDPNADIVKDLEGNPRKNYRPKDLAKAGKEPRVKSGGGSETDQVETYISSLQKSVQVLQAEAGALGKSNEEKTKAVDLAKAEAAARERGTPLTAAEAAQVERLADKQALLNKQIEDYKTKQEQANSRAQFFGNTLEGAIDSMVVKGGNLNQILLNVVQSLESAALKAAILGEGPFAGMFGAAAKNGKVGGLFGALWDSLPPFADGGIVPGSVGAAVPVLAHAGEMILNQTQQAQVANAMASGANVMVSHQIINNVPGVQVETKATRQGNGGVQMQTVLHQALAHDLASNGPTARMLQNTYGLSRSAGRG